MQPESTGTDIPTGLCCHLVDPLPALPTELPPLPPPPPFLSLSHASSRLFNCSPPLLLLLGGIFLMATASSKTLLLKVGSIISSGMLLERQNLRPHPGPVESGKIPRRSVRVDPGGCNNCVCCQDIAHCSTSKPCDVVTDQPA